jgi:magnesium transporter
VVQRLLKEFGVALLNGTICGLVIFVYSVVFQGNISLSLTVGVALLTVIIIAALFGTLVPLTLNKLRIDPALATGPFITTSNDIIGLTVYFNFAKYFFGL